MSAMRGDMVLFKKVIASRADRPRVGSVSHRNQCAESPDRGSGEKRPNFKRTAFEIGRKLLFVSPPDWLHPAQEYGDQIPF
jgi:hypothetical protein